MSLLTSPQGKATSYARDGHYPYLITGVFCPSISGHPICLSDFTSDLYRSQLCRHGAYVEHSPGLNCKLKFTIFNTCSADYQPQGNDVVNAEGLTFAVCHITDGGTDSGLIMTGDSRPVDISSDTSGSCQFAAKVAAFDIFSDIKIYQRGPVARTVKIR